MKKEWKKLEENGWEMKREFRQSQNIAILFVNHKLRQAVLSFQGISVNQEHFFDDDLANQAIVDSMLDSVMAITILNETIELIGDLNYFLSFTGYSFGALYAEQNVFLCRKFKPSLIHVQAVTFDSPGSLELLAYVCRDFNLSATLNDLKALKIVTYISSPNFVNSFGNHVGQIKYMYKDQADLIQMQEEIKRQDLLEYHFKSVGSMIGNNLNELYYNFSDNYSVALLTEQKSNIRIKEFEKKAFTELTKVMLQKYPKYAYIFLTLFINIRDKTKNLPFSDFDSSNYKRFQICESNECIQIFCEKTPNTIDSLLDELNGTDFEELTKFNCPEFTSLFEQMSFLKNAFSIYKQESEYYFESSSKDLPIAEIKRRYERLVTIKDMLGLFLGPRESFKDGLIFNETFFKYIII